MADEPQDELAWISELTDENFLAVYDVLLDIKNDMQLTEEPTIPLWQSMIKFPILMPMDSIGARDGYCEFRWKAVELLKRKNVINDFKYIEKGHRWESKISINANEKNVNTVVEIFNGLYEESTKEEDEEHDMQSTEVQAGDTLPLEPPDKVTIPWLLKHVPVMLWLAFIGLLFASYSFGVKTSGIPLVRDLYNLERGKLEEEYKNHENAFKNAEKIGTVEVYEDFLKQHSNSGWVDIAVFKRDRTAYKRAESIGTSEAYKDFLQRYPKSDWKDKAEYHINHAQK